MPRCLSTDAEFIRKIDVLAHIFIPVLISINFISTPFPEIFPLLRLIHMTKLGINSHSTNPTRRSLTARSHTKIFRKNDCLLTIRKLTSGLPANQHQSISTPPPPLPIPASRVTTERQLRQTRGLRSPPFVLLLHRSAAVSCLPHSS